MSLVFVTPSEQPSKTSTVAFALEGERVVKRVRQNKTGNENFESAKRHLKDAGDYSEKGPTNKRWKAYKSK